MCFCTALWHKDKQARVCAAVNFSSSLPFSCKKTKNKKREGGWMTPQLFFLPLSLPFPIPFPLSSVVEDGGLSVGDGMVRDGWRRFGGIGGGGS